MEVLLLILASDTNVGINQKEKYNIEMERVFFFLNRIGFILDLLLLYTMGREPEKFNKKLR